MIDITLGRPQRMRLEELTAPDEKKGGYNNCTRSRCSQHAGSQEGQGLEGISANCYLDLERFEEAKVHRATCRSAAA